MLRINKDMCTGCGLCVEICPFGALTIQDNKAVVNESGCRLCGVCMNACTFGAMSMVDDQQTAQGDASGSAAVEPNVFPSQPGFPSGGVGRGMGGMGRGMGGRGRGMGGGRRRA